MHGNSPHGLGLSLLLHTGVVVLVALLTVVEPFKKKPPIVFEMILQPPTADGPTNVGASAPDPSFEITRPKQPAVRPPPPRPTPVPAPAPPKVEPPKTTPTPTPPPPKQDAKPKPKDPPKKVDPPPPKVSYTQFVDKHGAPKTPPKTATPAASKTRTVPRISTSDLRDVFVTSGESDGMSAAQQDAMANYISRLRESLHNVWNRPVGLAQSTEAEVEFTIDPTGRLRNVRIVKSSGNPEYDRTVVEAFQLLQTAGTPPSPIRGALRLYFRLLDG